MKKWKKALSGVMAVSMILAIPIDLPVYAEISENANVLEKSSEHLEQEVKEITYYLENDNNQSEYFKLDENIEWWNTKVVSEDSEVCQASFYTYGDTGVLSFYGKQLGETRITLEDQEGNILKTYYVTVKYPEKKTYVDQVLEISLGMYSDDSFLQYLDVQSDDPSICDGEIISSDSPYSESKEAKVRLTGKTPGKIMVRITNDDIMVKRAYLVTVENLPDNIIRFKDDNLRKKLISDDMYPKVDVDDDDQISQEEMENLNAYRLNLSNAGITDLTGLEYAVNLKQIDLSGNTELENVDVLFQLDALTYLNLSDTGVPGEKIFELAKMEDSIIVRKGITKTLNSMFSFRMDLNSFYLEIVQGEDVIELLMDRPENIYDDCWKAKEVGNAVLRISCGDYYKDVNIRVEDLYADQPVGDVSDREIKSVGNAKILDDSGRLWEVYPEVRLERENVEQYVSAKVYGERTPINVNYAIDTDGTLWSGVQKLAENIKEVQGRYALRKDRTLIDIYSTEQAQTGDVVKWTEGETYRHVGNQSIPQGVTYALKADGTLWRRLEPFGENQGKTFIKIADGVKDIGDASQIYYVGTNDYYGGTYFLKYNGDLVYDDILNDTQEVHLSNVKDLPGQYYYKDLNGYSYVRLNYGSSKEKYVDVGKVNIIEALEYSIYVYYLTDDDTLWRYSENNGSENLASNVKKLEYGYNGRIIYMGKDGLYRDELGRTGSVRNPNKIFLAGYYLEDYGVANDYNLCYEGKVLLTHIKKAQNDGGRIVVTRTDGTVWKVEEEGVPEKILDLNTGTIDHEMTEAQKQEILSAIATSVSGNIIVVNMESAMILPKEILEAAQAKGVVLACKLGDGTVWEIDGSTLNTGDQQDIDLSAVKVTKEEGSISADTITEIAGKRDAEQLNFTGCGVKIAAALSLAVDHTFDTKKCLAVSADASDVKEDQILGMAMVENGKMKLALSRIEDCVLIYAVNGDTSGDERVNITDLMQTLHFVSGRSTLDVVEQGISDVDLNGYTNITDLMKMLHFVSGRADNL